MTEPASPLLEADALLRGLTARGVEFVVIGGIAAILHGSAQLTNDLDICHATNAGNLNILGQFLVDIGAQLKGVDKDVPFVPDAQTLRHVEVLTMVTPEGEIDVLARPAGSRGYEALRQHAERFDLGGFAVLVASIDDLIAMKLAAGRPKDLAAVDELEEIKRLQRER